MNLAEGEKKAALQKRLLRAVENRGFHIVTGFLSTPFILSVLAEAGQLEAAYKMLENEEAPSWLAEVNAGATTVWET
jgi:alpha-L-rhamnosidase